MTKEVVLGVHPTSRGFGFVVMTSPLSPLDWGFRGTLGKQKNAVCLDKIAALLEAHQPDVLAIEDSTAPGARRAARIKRLYRSISTLATDQAVDVQCYQRKAIKECFGDVGATTRYEIAVAIAKRVAAFERLLPPPRKIWMAESPNVSVFSAAALAITYFASAPS
jgi:Holliday junction resolvasome RuvABC endonuclease subunit